jgi:aromatic ring hydroxylase
MTSRKSEHAIGGRARPFTGKAKSREDLVAQRAAIPEWSRMTYGWMGWTPGYKASLANTHGANAECYGKNADIARRWFKRAQEAVFFMNRTMVSPPADRGRPTSEVKDLYIVRRPARALRTKLRGQPRGHPPATTTRAAGPATPGSILTA